MIDALLQNQNIIETAGRGIPVLVDTGEKYIIGQISHANHLFAAIELPKGPSSSDSSDIMTYSIFELPEQYTGLRMDQLSEEDLTSLLKELLSKLDGDLKDDLQSIACDISRSSAISNAYLKQLERLLSF